MCCCLPGILWDRITNDAISVFELKNIISINTSCSYFFQTPTAPRLCGSGCAPPAPQPALPSPLPARSARPTTEDGAAPEDRCIAFLFTCLCFRYENLHDKLLWNIASWVKLFWLVICYALHLRKPRRSFVGHFCNIYFYSVCTDQYYISLK